MQVAMVFTYSQKPVWLALAAAWYDGVRARAYCRCAREWRLRTHAITSS